MFEGRGGADQLIGMDGDDVLRGGDGNDLLDTFDYVERPARRQDELRQTDWGEDRAYGDAGNDTWSTDYADRGFSFESKEQKGGVLSPRSARRN
ncbi:MAG TPA: hypothetical protein VNA28_05155 [Solirubrobacteraceae bacterium]|nr:hypothetical protein [Solirubrobacteraceae bacterium]